MARLDEIAEGIATILVTSPVPEPLNVSLRGEGVAEMTFLVRAVIESCERRGSPVSVVRVGSFLGSELTKLYENKQSGFQGVKIEGADALELEIEFYRFTKSD